LLNFSGMSPNRVRVVAGTLRSDTPGSIHSVARIVMHEDYTSFNTPHDIALLEVNSFK